MSFFSGKGGGPAGAGKIGGVGALILAGAMVVLTVLNDQGGPQSSHAAGDLEFDYYVLALSWSPAHCEVKPSSDQCGQGRRFVLHGLWPQFEDGWPSDCASPHGRPSDATLDRFAKLTGARGTVAYQWRKHGACAGLPPRDYFDLVQRAYDSIERPEALRGARRNTDVDPRVIESAFLQANPRLSRDGVTIKCRDGRFSEVRICLTKDLQPRKCGRRVLRDCGAKQVELLAPR